MDQTLNYYRQSTLSYDYQHPVSGPVAAPSATMMHHHQQQQPQRDTVIIEDDYEHQQQSRLDQYEDNPGDGQDVQDQVNDIYRQSLPTYLDQTDHNSQSQYQHQLYHPNHEQHHQPVLRQISSDSNSISNNNNNGTPTTNHSANYEWMTSNTTVEDIEQALNQMAISSNSNNDINPNEEDEHYSHHNHHYHQNHNEIDPDSPGGPMMTTMVMVGNDDNTAVNQLPIHYAASQNCLELMRQLIQVDKLDVDLRDFESNTPLILAALNGHVEMVRFLVENNANLNAQNIFDNTAVHEASWRGYSQSLEILCRNKAKLHLKNKQGHTTLHLAAQKGHNQSCRIILLSGCKPNIKNNFGDTPLHSASRYGHIGMVRILISAFANVNELNKNDDTALHIAAAMGRKKLAKILLESGCNPTIINKQGETPMNIALRKSFFDIQEVIANPPTLKPIHLKQQELYVRPLQGSFKDIYSALPRSESYSSTNQQFEPSYRAQQAGSNSRHSPGHGHHHNHHHHNNHRHHNSHHNNHRKSADYPKRCKSDFSNGYLNEISATCAQSTSEKQGAVSVSKYYSTMLEREASPYEREQNRRSEDNDSLDNDNDAVGVNRKSAKPLQHDFSKLNSKSHRTGRNHRSNRDHHYHHQYSDFPKPKLETLPREPLAKGEQYYVDLSGHIYKGPIKRSSSQSNQHTTTTTTDSNKCSTKNASSRSANSSRSNRNVA